MTLSVDTAEQAGGLAAQARGLQKAIATLQAAIAGNVTMNNVTANSSAGELAAAIPLNASDTASVLNALLVVYQAILKAVTDAIAVIQ